MEILSSVCFVLVLETSLVFSFPQSDLRGELQSCSEYDNYS